MSLPSRSAAALAFGLVAALGAARLPVQPVERAIHAPDRPGAVTPAPAHRTVLHVAADPNNLPFSNERGEGFENKIAELIAKDLGLKVEYVWHAQRRGFFRQTFKEGPADMVAGVVTCSERVLTTSPYYRSTYVFVSRTDRKLGIKSLDDPRLKTLKVGVQIIGDDGNEPPPAIALGRRGLIEQMVGYTVYGDYRQENPPARILDAVVNGDVDLAIVWGPLAGYFGAKEPDALEITPVSPAMDGPLLPLVFDISLGVKKGDTALRDRIERVLTRRRDEINRILDEYHVPRGDPAVQLPKMGDNQ
jgi:mxaJ protein